MDNHQLTKSMKILSEGVKRNFWLENPARPSTLRIKSEFYKLRMKSNVVYMIHRLFAKLSY